ncbi:MAG: FMN-binding protein [Desulfotignum sp.]|nr:FMN-binding protein [Desulfotignum sp.]MCF8125205.1 FMN-binding protein [Desulfotignum sp.]
MSDKKRSFKKSRIYVVLFALATALVFSVLITSAATMLKERQLENMALDKKTNLLEAAGLVPEDKKSTPEEIKQIYDAHIREVHVDPRGRIVETPADSSLQLYLIHSDQQVQGYIVPISTRGLWGKIHGYLAFEQDGETVAGFSVYSHSETPGLGGEIESNWFQENFKGKKILNASNQLVSVGIAKGKVENLPEKLQDHYVDGISGATLTGRYLSEGLEETLTKYESVSVIFRQKKGSQTHVETILDE